ncbi:LuxR family transcriptional regulator [Pseudothauera nasutitermitis]|uniref:LuxR family transcriptional regulator n=1 Tax=Pseudothauera nasutitermitis TaxID=2565930 RepID=A0A4S4AUJ5_9RHOO|nr:LuxR family transcriptional regulator [Pseudothauera nasutitermitis]THF63629.1 LuxR family transcriptional regulator [Pseudothauera nasutitermitis]
MTAYLAKYRDYLEVLASPDMDELLARTQKLVKFLDFDHFMFGGHIHTGHGEPQAVHYGTYPAAWIERYRSNNYHLVDPCFAHMQHHVHPVPWARESFVGPDAQEMLEEASSFGVVSGGFSPLPCHALGNFGFGIARGDSRPGASARAAAHLPEMHMLASYFLESFRSIQKHASQPVALTARERQCLVHAANGLRDGEIAAKLRISTRTVFFHLNNARTKLRADNRSQMVAKSVILGIVAP